MSASIVLPIHSLHVRNIYSGVKRFEYRTRKPVKEVSYIAIYETGGVGAVTGVAKVAGVLEGSPNDIWGLTKSFAGVTKRFFQDYFSGKKRAIAYCLEEVIEFSRPVQLREIGVHRAPQSFQYIEESAMAKLLEKEIEAKKPLAPRFFVGGVHGAGKSTLMGGIADEMGLALYSASGMISKTQKTEGGKCVPRDKMLENQNALINALRQSDWFVSGGILDGHFVLRDEQGTCQEIPCEVFSQMDLDAMYVIVSRPSIIARRLNLRDGAVWSESDLELMQEQELSHARRVAKHLKIPISIVR